MRNGKTSLSLWITALILFGPASLLADKIYLFGTIGDSPAGAVIERQDQKLTGWYFHGTQVREIRLEGIINRDGNFRMKTFPEGKQQEHFEGVVKGTLWQGIYQNSSVSKPLAFSLKENRDQLQHVSENFDCKYQERDDEFSYTYQWNLKLTIVDGIVKELYAMQESIGEDQDAQHCSIDLPDLKPIPSDAGILFTVVDENSHEPEQRSIVRIVGDANILWIQFGDTSEEGNDCRQAGNKMFCSPRAFWNDLILDRRTHTCRPLK
jgi:hypothetical protein